MIKDHIKDIDFRKREVRQQEAVKDFKQWYAQLSQRPYSEMLQGQLSMLSAVLWYLLPPKEYKKLVTSKKDLNAPTTPIQML